jgi:hypothetical protein
MPAAKATAPWPIAAAGAMCGARKSMVTAAITQTPQAAKKPCGPILVAPCRHCRANRASSHTRTQPATMADPACPQQVVITSRSGFRQRHKLAAARRTVFGSSSRPACQRRPSMHDYA